MDVTKPYKFKGLGAMDVTEPYTYVYIYIYIFVFLSRFLSASSTAQVQPVRPTIKRSEGGELYHLHIYIYNGFLSIGISIDWQRPETTVETNPVCWKIEPGSLRACFCYLLGQKPGA